MKAKEFTNKNRIITTIGLLVFTISLGYGQGLLAEGAMKLFKVNKPDVELNAPQFIFVDYNSENENNFRLKDFIREVIEEEMDYELIAEANISRTIHVSAVEISYENEIETEEWMITPLENNLEECAVESWMTSSFTESVESNLTVENWMTESFTESTESTLAVEDWMTASFAAAFEADLTTEEWMTQPLTESMESEINVEDWMTVSFTESTEQELTVEDWMTQSLISE